MKRWVWNKQEEEGEGPGRAFFFSSFFPYYYHYTIYSPVCAVPFFSHLSLIHPKLYALNPM